MARQWVRIAWWLPISYGEWVRLSNAERVAIASELIDLQKERDSKGDPGSLTGQSRQDRRQGL